MSYGMGISFPSEPTKKDIKELRRQVAHDRLEVINGEWSDSAAGSGATRSTSNNDRASKESGGESGT